MSGEAIEIEYQLTVDDYAKYTADRSFSTLFNVTSLPWLLRLLVIGIFVPHFLIAFIYLVTGSKSLSDLLYIAFIAPFNPYTLAFMFFVLLTYFFLYRFLMYPVIKSSGRAMAKRGKNIFLLSVRKIVLSVSGISETSAYSDFSLNWAGVESIKINNHDLIFNLSTVNALFVPSRFFKSEEEKQRIYQQCLKWWEAAREMPVAAEGVA